MYSRIIATLLTYATIGTVSIAGIWMDKTPSPIHVEAEPIEIVEVVDVSFGSGRTRSTGSDNVNHEFEQVTRIDTIEPVTDDVSQEEIELLALVTMAEAEGECEEGKRLVIDTILNRVDSVYFPDTITEVIYQKNQFTSMWNGRVDRCYVDEDICELVREELANRTNYDVMFFHAGKYGKYGKPLFQVENHYFSSYD